MTTVIYAWITYPMVFSSEKQNDFIPKLRSFKKEIIDSSEYLSDYDQYGLFARISLKLNFNRYAAIAALWRLSMSHRGTVSRLWNFFR